MTFGPIDLTPPFALSFSEGPSRDTIRTLDVRTGQIAIDNWRACAFGIPPYATGSVRVGFSTMVRIPNDNSTRLTFSATFSGTVRAEAVAFLGYSVSVLKLWISVKGTRSDDRGAEADDYILGYFTPVFYGAGLQTGTTATIQAVGTRSTRFRSGPDSWQVAAGVLSSATCAAAAGDAVASVLGGGITMMSVSGA